MDEYLKPFVQGITLPDKPLKEMQDHVLDVFGPLSTIYENLLVMLESCNSGGAVELDKDSVLNFLTCLKHAMLLAGDASARLSVSRRELVLKKINPLMVSLAQEHFPNTERHLFGPNFEQRLKTRSETAETIGKASRLGKPFFVEGPPETSWEPPVESVQASPPIPTNYGTQGQYYTSGSRTIHQIPEPTVLQTQSVRNQRPTNLLKGMFLEILQPNLIQKAPQTGRLNHFISQWMMLTQDLWVFQTIQGHHIEFMSPAVQHSSPGMPSLPPPQEKVLDQGMKELLAKKAIHQVQTHTPSNRGFISSIFIVPKKDGGNRPVINLKPLNQFLIQEHFKMEEIHMLRDLLKQNDSCKDRPQRRLPNCANLERSSEIPSISVEGNTARICLPPLWVSHSPQGVHKVDETSTSGFKTTGYLSNNLPRRYTNYGTIASLSIIPCSFNSEPPGGSGIYSQLQQVPVNPLPEYRVFGFSDQFNQSHPPVTRGETQENPKDLPRYSRKDRNFGSRVIKIPGPPNLFHPGHFPRPPPLPTSSKAEEHYNDLRAIVRGHINTRFSSPRGSSVVARSPSRVEWQSAIPTPNRPYNRDRCLSKGLGVSTGGPWCSEEKRLHINCLELLAGLFAIKTFTKTTACAHVRLLMDNAAAVAYIDKMGVLIHMF